MIYSKSLVSEFPLWSFFPWKLRILETLLVKFGQTLESVCSAIKCSQYFISSSCNKNKKKNLVHFYYGQILKLLCGFTNVSDARREQAIYTPHSSHFRFLHTFSTASFQYSNYTTKVQDLIHTTVISNIRPVYYQATHFWRFVTSRCLNCCNKLWTSFNFMKLLITDNFWVSRQCILAESLSDDQCTGKSMMLKTRFTESYGN